MRETENNSICLISKVNTFDNHNVLTNYSLIRFLNRLGFEKVELTNFPFEQKSIPTLKSDLKRIFTHKKHNISNEEFINRNISISNLKLNYHSDLSFLNNFYDAFALGIIDSINYDDINHKFNFIDSNKIVFNLSHSTDYKNKKLTDDLLINEFNPIFLLGKKDLVSNVNQVQNKVNITFFSLGNNNFRVENGNVLQLDAKLNIDSLIEAIINSSLVVTDSLDIFILSTILERTCYVTKKLSVKIVDALKRFGINHLFIKIKYNNKMFYIIDDENKLRDDLSKAKNKIISSFDISKKSLNNITSSKPKSIDIKYLENCLGCYACYNACPTKAIEMIENKDGFFYASVNNNKCIECGKCRTVCPILHPILENKNVDKAYLAYSKDNEILNNSSSGGVFFELAKYILSKGGYVAGCVSYNNGFRAKHIVSNDIEDVKAMRKSKYIESEINDLYKDIKNLLENNKLVMFTGTPCQCVGLSLYLRKDYDNLFLVDLICHGVGSNRALDYLKKGNKVKSIEFRHKENEWEKVNSLMINSKLSYNDLFLDEFHRDVIIRNSCQLCMFKGSNRASNITIGDFWGIEKILNISLGKGKSLIVTNDIKGEILLKEITNLYIKELPQDVLEMAVKENPSYYSSNNGINIYSFGFIDRCYYSFRKFLIRAISKIKR